MKSKMNEREGNMLKYILCGIYVFFSVSGLTLIKIGSNNQLSIDENTLKKANITTLKSLFQGTGSYAAEVSRKASDISSIAQQEIDSAKTYSNKGGYIPSYSSGTLFDSFF